MSIYYNEIKNISRSAGRSAVAAAAYRSGTNLYRSETDTYHDYSRKKEVVYADIITPPVPSRDTIAAEIETDNLVEIERIRNQFRENMDCFYDREHLWNEVERIESKSDSRLAREFRVAIPREFSRDEQIAVAREYGQFLASEGMIVDVAVHDKGDGNPHAHIMTTTRPLCIDGTWRMAKELKRFRVILKQNGTPLVDEQHPFFWRHKTDPKQFGIRIPQWDEGKMKQFQAWFREKSNLTFHESDLSVISPKYFQNEEVYNEFFERLVSCQKTRLRKGKGEERLWQRETILDNEFNRKENVERWREQWAVICNRELSRQNIPLIDHRSYERQGVETIPQIHEGYVARKIEEAGGISERCEYNRRVRSVNVQIRKLSDRLIQTSHEIKEVIIAKIRGLIERTDTALDRRAREEVGTVGIESGIELAKLRGSVAANNKRTRAAINRITNRKPGNEDQDRSSKQYEQAIELREREAVGRKQSLSKADRYIDEYKTKWESDHIRRIQRIRDIINSRIHKEGFVERLYETVMSISSRQADRGKIINKEIVPEEEKPKYVQEPVYEDTYVMRR